MRKRYGQMLRVRPEHRDEYIRYHSDVWPDVLDLIHKYNIRNYSIYLHGDVLFSYLEYVGEDYERDMAAMGDEPRMRDWWNVMEPMQHPLDTRKPGEWWASMDEVFHTDER